MALGALACGQERGNAWVARVDGHEVPISLLHRRAEPRLEGEGGTERETVYAEELERLLANQLGLNRAAGLGVGP